MEERLSREEWVRRIDEFMYEYIHDFDEYEKFYVPGNSPQTGMRWAVKEVHRAIALDRSRAPIYSVIEFRDELRYLSRKNKKFATAYWMINATVENFT